MFVDGGLANWNVYISDNIEDFDGDTIKAGVELLANKLGEGVPNIIDEIKAGHISMVINTTSHGRDSERDGFKIRRSTVEHAIACLTSLDTARELQRAMSAMRRRRVVSVVALQDLSWED